MSSDKINIFSREYAESLDAVDSLSRFRAEFLFPKHSDGCDVLYLCGNSLGLQPRRLREHINTQLDKWANEGVEGHFLGSTPWLDIDEIVAESMSTVVGAHKHEVVMMNSLTCNLHLMMAAFYCPTPTRFKILVENKAFPSDYHAVISQIQHHNYNPEQALHELYPRPNEITLRDDDIVRVIEESGDSIALVLLSGVQYYTGQYFDIERITAAAKRKGCMVGFDLAHAVGNVELRLHEWQCDFACWCSYKYLNCGPGSIGGCFVHQKHHVEENNTLTDTTTTTSLSSSSLTTDRSYYTTQTPNYRKRLAGWWGHRRSDRFVMSPQFVPCAGADGFRLSNPSVLLVATVRASLDFFDEVRWLVFHVCLFLTPKLLYVSTFIK